MEQAIAAISAFPDSEAKDGLIEMATKSLKRRKYNTVLYNRETSDTDGRVWADVRS